MHLLSLQAAILSWLKTWLGLCAQVIREPFSTVILFSFPLGNIKRKTIVALPFFLTIICYCSILQYFPPPNVHMIPQSHHQSAHVSVQFSVTLLQNMIIKALLIIITNSLLPLYALLSNAYWQGWNGNDGLSWPLPINLAHMRLGSFSQKI